MVAGPKTCVLRVPIKTYPTEHLITFAHLKDLGTASGVDNTN